MQTNPYPEYHWMFHLETKIPQFFANFLWVKLHYRKPKYCILRIKTEYFKLGFLLMTILFLVENILNYG